MVSKVDICNLALSRLGDKRTVEDIDAGKKNEELVFKKWYDITRQSTIKRSMPSFAMVREFWPKANYVPEFGYNSAYLYKSDCLRVLGIGNIENTENNYSREGNYLLCDEDYPNGLPVRYLKDISETQKFPSDFVELLSYELAANVCTELTESQQLLNYIQQILPLKRLEFTGLSSQENKPIRISNSRFNRTGTYIGKK